MITPFSAYDIAVACMDDCKRIATSLNEDALSDRIREARTYIAQVRDQIGAAVVTPLQAPAQNPRP